MPKLDLRGLTFTTAHTVRAGRLQKPDHLILADECPDHVDRPTLRGIGRALGWSDLRIDDAILAGIRAGVFRN